MNVGYLLRSVFDYKKNESTKLERGGQEKKDKSRFLSFKRMQLDDRDRKICWLF